MKGSHAPRPRKNLDTVHNEAWLRARYVDDRMSAPQIAALVGCSHPTIFHALRKFGIPSRTLSESRSGHPSTAVWTPEMREEMRKQRRGDANPMFGTVSPNRDKFTTGPTRRTGRTRAQIAYPPEPCDVCGTLPVHRHHVNGDTMDNRRENIRFLCPPHHVSVGHPGTWGGGGWDAGTRARIGAEVRKRWADGRPPIVQTPERRAAASARMREVWRKAKES